MKTFIFTLTFYSFFFLHSLSVNAQSNWINGTWEGKGKQFDIKSTWTISLECNSENKTFKISYPSLNCGGDWVIVEEAADHIKFKEQLSFGLDKCLNNGTVVITKKGGKLLYKYYYPDDKTLNAKGVLIKLN